MALLTHTLGSEEFLLGAMVQIGQGSTKHTTCALQHGFQAKASTLPSQPVQKSPQVHSRSFTERLLYVTKDYQDLAFCSLSPPFKDLAHTEV